MSGKKGKRSKASLRQQKEKEEWGRKETKKENMEEKISKIPVGHGDEQRKLRCFLLLYLASVYKSEIPFATKMNNRIYLFSNFR